MQAPPIVPGSLAWASAWNGAEPTREGPLLFSLSRCGCEPFIVTGGIRSTHPSPTTRECNRGNCRIPTWEGKNPSLQRKTDPEARKASIAKSARFNPRTEPQRTSWEGGGEDNLALLPYIHLAAAESTPLQRCNPHLKQEAGESRIRICPQRRRRAQRQRTKTPLPGENHAPARK